MPATKLAILVAIFFLTSLVSVVTGSTSLITVPAMIALGVEPHIAVATNMMALVFMSIGGSAPFIGNSIVSRVRLPGILTVTVVGSALGALLLLRIPRNDLDAVIATAMIAIALFTLLNPEAGTTAIPVSQSRAMVGYAVAFLLAVYGGFFSGGYVTLLTVAFVWLFGMTFLQSVATTKVANVFSSLVATLVFAWHGAVDYKLGVTLGIAMFFGAIIGGCAAAKIRPVWVRRVFVIVIIGLAIKILASSFL